MAALLPATTTTIGIALVIDAVACIVLLQGVIYGIRLIHSEDVRERNR